MAKTIFRCWSVFLLLALVGLAHGAERVLKVGVIHHSPPMSYVDASGGLTGFNVEVMRELCKELAARCETVVLTLDRVVDAFGDVVFHSVIRRTVKFPETTVAGEPITGYLTRTRGVTVHRADCPALARLSAAYGRVLDRHVQRSWVFGLVMLAALVCAVCYLGAAVQACVRRQRQRMENE